MAEQRALNAKLLRLAPETGLPLVVTNDLHYVHEQQADAQDVLLCVGTGNNLDTPARMKFEGRDFWLKSAAQMAALFPDQPEAIRNTRLISEMASIQLPLGQLRIPHFPVPDGETVESWLAQGVPARPRRALRRGHAGAPAAPRLRARRDHLDGLRRLLPDRRRLHPVRPRAADPDDLPRQRPGSIVTYTLGITPVDPIAYQLPFERFLNPDRVTMPDIDVDFEDGRRDEVIAYVTRKYGTDHVAQIITFGTMLARAAIRDVGRVLGHSLRRRRPHRQGRPEPARHQARRGARDRPGAALDGRRRPVGQADHRLRPAARGRRPQRLHPRRRRRDHRASR